VEFLLLPLFALILPPVAPRPPKEVSPLGHHVLAVHHLGPHAALERVPVEAAAPVVVDKERVRRLGGGGTTGDVVAATAGGRRTIVASNRSSIELR